MVASSTTRFLWLRHHSRRRYTYILFLLEVHEQLTFSNRTDGCRVNRSCYRQLGFLWKWWKVRYLLRKYVSPYLWRCYYWSASKVTGLTGTTTVAIISSADAASSVRYFEYAAVVWRSFLQPIWSGDVTQFAISNDVFGSVRWITDTFIYI